MLAPLAQSVLGAPPPTFPATGQAPAPIQTSNEIAGGLPGMGGPIGQPPMQSGLSAPMTAPAMAGISNIPTAPAPEAVKAPLSEPKQFRSKYDDIFEKAEGILSETLQKKQGIDPVGLAMIQGFLSPTKTGSFGESISNVAGRVREAQNEESRGDVSRLQAQMQLASAGSLRERENEVQRLMGSLYEKTPQGLKTNVEIAKQLSGYTKDPRFVQQAIAEEQQTAMRNVGMNMFKPKIVPGKEGQPSRTVMEFNPNAVYELMKISPDPMKAISDYAKTIPELRKAGLIEGLKEEGTPFDALAMMGPTDLIKAQAQKNADLYSKGLLDPDKAAQMANTMLTMATAHMDRESQNKFHQMMSGMMMSMKQDSAKLMREKFEETQKENMKKYSDQEKILYKNSVIPIINQGAKASEALVALSQIQDVVSNAPSGVFAGLKANSVGALFGTDDNTALRNLQSMSRSLLPLVPRLPGSASNLDAKNLLQSIGELENPMLTNKQRVDIIHKVAVGFQALQNRANEVETTWESSRKLPTWATPTNLGLTQPGAPATPAPAPSSSQPIGSGNYIIQNGKLVPAP